MYKPLQKKTSDWTPTPIQKKSKGKSGNFSVLPKLDKKSDSQSEMPTYSRAAADYLAAKMMASIEARGQESKETTSIGHQSEAEVATPELQAKEVSIQRECADCANEQQEQSAAEGKEVDEMSLNASGIQAKLTVGAPGDPYEQEADRVAAQVMSMPDNSPQVQRFGEDNPIQRWFKAPSITPVVQMQVDEDVQMWHKVQRAGGGNEASGDLESRLNASKGGGNPLAPEVRAFMEPRFNSDFSSVRVHTGSDSVQMNRELGAQAFAHGSDVYFGEGKDPGNNELTAHELTHVVEQGGGVQLQPAPPKPPNPKPSTSSVITSETVATTPGAQTRTTIGVGETVNLTHPPGSTSWTTTSGQLSATTGVQIQFTAPDIGQSVKVTAGTSTIAFSVIPPSSVYMSRYLGTGIKHTQNRPDSGIQTRLYLLPDNVNFFNVQIREVDVPGVGTGVYSPFNGVSHSPHPATIPLNNIVVPSKGTQVNGKDTVYSGDPMTPAPFAPGAIAFAIPYEYKVGSGSFHRFATVTQTSTLASDGSTLTSSKAGATGGTTVAAPTSTF